MPTAILLRATRNTNLWRKGQRLWVIWMTGALAAYCLGRYRGKGRWIRAWAHWPDKDGHGFFCRPDARWIGAVEITPEFHALLCRWARADVEAS